MGGCNTILNASTWYSVAQQQTQSSYTFNKERNSKFVRSIEVLVVTQRTDRNGFTICTNPTEVQPSSM